MIENIDKRVKNVIEHLRFKVFPELKIVFTQKELSMQIDMAEGNITNAKKGDKRYINAFIEKVNNRFGNIINEEWYLTGKGSMLKSKSEETVSHEEVLTPVKTNNQGVPYYNVDFIGGFDLVENEQTAAPDYYIDFQKYNNADCWCNV